MRTDGHDEANSRFWQFCERALNIASETTKDKTSAKSVMKEPGLPSVFSAVVILVFVLRRFFF